VNASVLPRLGLAVLLLAAGLAPAENWPQWRGPNNDGVSPETGLPAEWSAIKNVAWKLKMPGAGGSTPIVWGDRLFLTSQDGDRLVALCVGTAGKELWKKDLGQATRQAGFGRKREGNGASATPSTDGKHVWFFVGNGNLAAFDLDGKEQWRFNAQERYGRFRIQFGMHTTPVLFGDRLYFQLIHSGGGQVVCIDKATGKDVWKVARPSDGTDENEHSYASAFVWQGGKDAYLVVHGNDYATAHSLKDGKEIWRVVDLNPRTRYNRTLRFVASPVCTPELIVVPSAKNGPVVAVKPDATGEVKPGSPGEAWRMPKGTPDVPSPLVHDGLVYLAGERGSLTCLEAKTGKQLYRQETHSFLHRASPVLADGKLYLTAADGTTTVVVAGRTFRKLATNRLPDYVTASPAVSGGRIYLRGWEHLWAIEQKK
jgi:outer membrane protein assembly factor BamB